MIEYNNNLYFGQNKTLLAKYSDITSVSQRAYTIMNYVAGNYSPDSGTISNNLLETYKRIVSIPSFSKYAIAFIKFSCSGAVNMSRSDLYSNLYLTLCSGSNVHNVIYEIYDNSGETASHDISNEKNINIILFFTFDKQYVVKVTSDTHASSSSQVTKLNFEVSNLQLGMQLKTNNILQKLSSITATVAMQHTIIYY